MPIHTTIQTYVNHFNEILEKRLNAQPIKAPRLKDALLYASLNGGKRIRAILIYLSGQSFDAQIEALDYAACAIELIHAYSLVHDDLPAMDNDTLRRGKPTCHIQFDEATAILTGDLMQSLAFEFLTHPDLKIKYQIKETQMLKAIRTLSDAANQMVSGQVLDLQSENKKITFQELKQIHELKTGALITAALTIGLLFSPNDQNEHYLNLLTDLGASLGLAFQIQDDILDITTETEILGKIQGSDLSQGKSTYPSLLGLDQSHRLLEEAFTNAYDIAKKLPNHTKLVELIHWIQNRNY